MTGGGGADGAPEVVPSSPSLRRLSSEGAVAQLGQGQGRMAELGSEAGSLMLDWVEGVARLLKGGDGPEQVEAEAREILARGVRHVIWAGMGGSVMTVRVLTNLNICGDDSLLRIYPLDSTDPAALNEIIRAIAGRKGIDLGGSPNPRGIFDDVLMVGVSMGMTSEEPITHLEWFTRLLEQAGLAAGDHALVMTLPGSYLDSFAAERGIPTRSLQLDGRSGTPGRMSAPTTRVFLLPAALALAGSGGAPGQLRTVLEEAWRIYDLPLARDQPERHPAVRMAAALSDAAVEGVCRLLFRTGSPASALVPWIEQLMEESLGKGGKGILVFGDGQIGGEDGGETRVGTIRARVEAVCWGNEAGGSTEFAREDVADRLAAVAACFLGWQLTMALYAYLQDITFAGQPAVENYKARSRVLRRLSSPLEAAIKEGVATPARGGTLVAPPGATAHLAGAATFANALQTSGAGLAYLDFTVNGELSGSDRDRIGRVMRTLGDEVLHVPVKLRRAPAAYHSTEQSEMDGPPGLISLRTIARHHEPVLLGSYDDTFLAAQAVATWQAMNEQGRACFLLILDTDSGGSVDSLMTFLDDVIRHVRAGEVSGESG